MSGPCNNPDQGISNGIGGNYFKSRYILKVRPSEYVDESIVGFKKKSGGWLQSFLNLGSWKIQLWFNMRRLLRDEQVRVVLKMRS